MPYFVYTVSHRGFSEAPVTMEFADSNIAWEQAVTSCAEAISDLGNDFGSDDDWHLTVSDGNSKPLFELCLTSRKL